MKGQDYPIHHFELMRELAVSLKSLPVQILSHEYSYESFGSWWFEYMFKGNRFRVVFDGKDRNLRLETNLGDRMMPKWDKISTKDITENSIKEVIDEVLSILKDSPNIHME